MVSEVTFGYAGLVFYFGTRQHQRSGAVRLFGDMYVQVTLFALSSVPFAAQFVDVEVVVVDCREGCRVDGCQGRSSWTVSSWTRWKIATSRRQMRRNGKRAVVVGTRSRRSRAGVQTTRVLPLYYDFDVASSVPEEMLGVLVPYVSGIVVADLRDDVPALEDAIGRRTKAYFCDDQRRIDIGTADKTEAPGYLGRVPLQRDEDLVSASTHGP